MQTFTHTHDLICPCCGDPITEEQWRVVHRSEPLHTSCVGHRLLPIRRLDDLVEAEIRDAIRLCDGDKERAAKMLGISWRTIYRKLKQYGLRRTVPR